MTKTPSDTPLLTWWANASTSTSTKVQYTGRLGQSPVFSISGNWNPHLSSEADQPSWQLICQLPGTSVDQGHFRSMDDATAQAERVVRVWIEQSDLMVKGGRVMSKEKTDEHLLTWDEDGSKSLGSHYIGKLGKQQIFSVQWDNHRASHNGPPWGLMCNLPGISTDLGYFRTLQDAMLQGEIFTEVWLERCGLVVKGHE